MGGLIMEKTDLLANGWSLLRRWSREGDLYYVRHTGFLTYR